MYAHVVCIIILCTCTCTCMCTTCTCTCTYTSTWYLYSGCLWVTAVIKTNAVANLQCTCKIKTTDNKQYLMLTSRPNMAPLSSATLDATCTCTQTARACLNKNFKHAIHGGSSSTDPQCTLGMQPIPMHMCMYIFNLKICHTKVFHNTRSV